MFPADSPLAALSVTWGTLMGQAVLALAEACGRGGGRASMTVAGHLWACAQILGKNTVSGVTRLRSGAPRLCLWQSPSLCVHQGAPSLGDTDAPGPGASGRARTQVSGGHSKRGVTEPHWQDRSEGVKRLKKHQCERSASAFGGFKMEL